MAVKKSVLLVCSSENTLSALAAILHQAGESTLTAQSALDAWECIKTGSVNCIIQDATIPDADCLALFRSTRSSMEMSTLPFLFLVHKEYSPPNLENAGSEISRDDWLGLPCSAEEFLKSARALMDRAAKLVKQGPVRFGPPPATDSSAAAAAVQTTKPPDVVLDAASTAFAGQLGVLDITKILSMVEPLRLTGVLSVSDGKRIGQIHFVEGAVRHAELNDIEGADALFLLFHMKTGAFRFGLESPTEKATIQGNTMALLLEGLRQMDEAKALIKAFRDQKAGRSEAPSLPAAGS